MEGGYTKLVTGILGLFIVIICCVMIFWSISPNLIETGTTDEIFTGYTQTSNDSAWSVELDDAPTGASGTNVSCWNASNDMTSSPSFSVNGRTVSVAAGAAAHFSQVNVSYTSQKTDSAGSANDMFTAVVPLMVLIGLVLVAGVLIMIITKFGGG